MSKCRGRTWTLEEYVAALDAYLSASLKQFNIPGRAFSSIKNVVYSDIPRNYRECISDWLKGASKTRRSGRDWKAVEIEYLQQMKNNHISPENMSTVLGRPEEEIKAKMRQLWPPDNRPTLVPLEQLNRKK